jgi:predicted ATPase
LHCVIAHRIGRLSQVQQQLLEIASVAGRFFDAITMARVARMDLKLFEDACEALCAQESFIQREAQSTARSTSHRYYFRHAIYQQAFYERQGPIRVASLHRRFDETLEQGRSIEISDNANTPALHASAATRGHDPDCHRLALCP